MEGTVKTLVSSAGEGGEEQKNNTSICATTGMSIPLLLVVIHANITKCERPARSVRPFDARTRGREETCMGTARETLEKTQHLERLQTFKIKVCV